MAQAKKKDSSASRACVSSKSDEEAAIWVDISELTPWDRNPRINDAAVPAVVDSIKRFGFASPIIARKEDGEIIAGHTRLKAAENLGLKKVPVRYMDLDPADAHLLAIADNKLNEKADWNDRLVAEALSEFSFEDAELAGFDSKELERLGSDLLGDDKEPPPGEIPDPPAEPVTKLGDVWILGDHRLICGDSTGADISDWQPVRCIWTDPPYGVSHVGGSKDPRDKKNHRSGPEVTNDAMPHDQLQQLISSAVGRIPAVSGAALYMASPGGDAMRMMMDAYTGAEYGLRHVLVWVKPQFVFGRSDYHYRHEPILYGWRKGAHLWSGDRKQDSVFEYENGNRNVAHPTSKPVGLIVDMLRNSTEPGDYVADPFGGSGSTLMACEQLGLKAQLIEISSQFCDVIVKRWEDYTGKKAVLEERKAA